jgi:MFS family permease
MRDYTFAEALRSPLLWAVIATMLTLSAGQSFMLAHSQVHLREMGISPTDAASTMSILSIFLVVGNLGFGFFASKIELQRIYVLAIALFVGGLMVLAHVDSLPMLYAYAVVAGVGFGGSQVGTMAILGHYWGTKVFPSLIALGLLIQTIGGSGISIFAGSYFDAHHTYLPVLYAIAALNVVASAALLLMPNSRVTGAFKPA